ncbi:MAG: TIGR02300 family protein [Proteobacteria bacterium]|nr:TIGR02300 family protein [Pseudomonadota bacterium]MCK5496572.1 TIGR02300 family protein [Hyphomicrobiaceae bacterium]
MAKPEWGTKRICQSCSAPFYDLRRDPIVCPKCAAVFDPEAILKSRKLKIAEEIAPAPKKETKDPEEILKAEGDDEAVADEDDGDAVLEDASDLGDEDVSEVIETGKDKDET